jgi:hypothetical protein
MKGELVWPKRRPTNVPIQVATAQWRGDVLISGFIVMVVILLIVFFMNEPSLDFHA